MGALRVVADEDTIIIIEGGYPNQIKTGITQNRSQIDKPTSDGDCEKLQERMAKLAGGIAVLRVGTPRNPR